MANRWANALPSYWNLCSPSQRGTLGGTLVGEEGEEHEEDEEEEDDDEEEEEVSWGPSAAVWEPSWVALGQYWTILTVLEGILNHLGGHVGQSWPYWSQYLAIFETDHEGGPETPQEVSKRLPQRAPRGKNQ